MYVSELIYFFFFFQAEDGIRDVAVTGVQTCALPIYLPRALWQIAPARATAFWRLRWCWPQAQPSPSEFFTLSGRPLTPVSHAPTSSQKKVLVSFFLGTRKASPSLPMASIWPTWLRPQLPTQNPHYGFVLWIRFMLVCCRERKPPDFLSGRPTADTLASLPGAS